MTDTALDRLRVLVCRASDDQYIRASLIDDDWDREDAALIVQSVRLARLVADPETEVMFRDRFERACEAYYLARSRAHDRGRALEGDLFVITEEHAQSILEWLAQRAGE